MTSRTTKSPTERTVQQSLFDAPVPAVRRGLSRPTIAILRMLRDRPRAGVELIVVTHRFDARVDDLRRAGCRIAREQDDRTGDTIYALLHEPAGLA